MKKLYLADLENLSEREIIGVKEVFDPGTGRGRYEERPLRVDSSIEYISQTLKHYSIKELVDPPWYEQLEETGPVWCSKSDSFGDDLLLTKIGAMNSTGGAHCFCNEIKGRIEEFKPLTQEQLGAFGLKNGFEGGGE